MEEIPPYVIVGGDSIWTQADTPLQYEGGFEALSTFLDEGLKYPESGNDSCSIGSIDVQILVERDGNVRILDIIDYADLGFDFWYAAISASTATRGKWKPAEHEGRKVPAAYDINATFVPTIASCETRVNDFRKAVSIK